MRRSSQDPLVCAWLSPDPAETLGLFPKVDVPVEESVVDVELSVVDVDPVSVVAAPSVPVVVEVSCTDVDVVSA
ncbi:hypothetical protein GCM10009619_16830 [Williamsia maris]